MIKRTVPILALACVFALGFGQQTPPIQPKTVDVPKLQPLVAPGLPKGGEIIANAPLSAAEAVRIALAHQPQIGIAKATADAAHGATLQVQALGNPTVAVSGTATHAQVIQSGSQALVGGNQSDMSTAIVLNQLIFDFNKTRDMVRQAQALERASYKSFGQTQQDYALLVKQDFYAYVQAQQEAKVQEANVKSRQSQLDLTQATVNAGTGEPLDLVSAKTLTAQSVLAWSQSLQVQETARTKLALDMGIDPRTPIDVSPSTELEVQLPTDGNVLVDQALKQRPSILAAIETLKASGFGVSVARKNNVPTLNFQAGMDTAGPENPFDRQTGFVSLTLGWTLIDGGVKLGKVREAEANKSAAALALRQASLTAMQEVSNAIVAIQTARQQIPVADSEVANAQEGVRLAQGRYRAGVTTFQEIITAQANLVTAQTDQVNSVAALAIAFATLDHAIGKWPVN